MPVVLGVDSSTQACKVEVRDADDGSLLASGRAPHPPVQPPRAEQDPRAWWRALVDAVRQTGVREVDAIAVAGQQHGLVVLDERREPLRAAKLWNDTESAPDAEWLLDQLGGSAAWADACGSVPVASFTITKLSWLHRQEPEVWARLAFVCLPHDYLNLRLTGDLFTDRGDASGTGYWSPRDGRYRTDLLAIVDDHRSWEQALPCVLEPLASGGRLSTTAADELGLRGRPLVSVGTGDNMGGALGIGLRSGDVAVSLGTSGTAYSVSERATADPTGAVAGFADATGRFLPLVCTLNATGVTDAMARLLDVELDRLDAMALHAPPGSGGVVLVPYFAGERTPNRPNATGAVTGLQADVTREQLARAAFEGVVCSMLDAVDALRSVGVATGDGRMLLVGGGARSRAYRQVLADVAARELVVPHGDELVATGACVQAAAVLGQERPEQVASTWQQGTASLVAPHEDVDHEAIRAAYAAARG